MAGRRVLVLGFGAIVPATLHLLTQYTKVPRESILVLVADPQSGELAKRAGFAFQVAWLTPANYEIILSALLAPEDVLLNLTYGVSSIDLIILCQRKRVLYLDTSIETWNTSDASAPMSSFDRRLLALGHAARSAPGSSALICHGANPGLITHFVKRALLEVSAALSGWRLAPPSNSTGWATLARDLGVAAINISEMDSQEAVSAALAGESRNTWSVDGLLEEFREVTGLAWGSNEPPPTDDWMDRMVHKQCELLRLGCTASSVLAMSWTPSCGAFEGFLVPHPEIFSIAQYLTLPAAPGVPRYQPTVKFVYRPCPDARSAVRFAVAGLRSAGAKRILMDDISSGGNELGAVILFKEKSRIFWFGSQLDINNARALCRGANATTLQVAAGVVGGFVWLIDNPSEGIVEPEQIDHELVLEIAQACLGQLSGCWVW
jgi:homospermidine synthase